MPSSSDKILKGASFTEFIDKIDMPISFDHFNKLNHMDIIF